MRALFSDSVRNPRFSGGRTRRRYQCAHLYASSTDCGRAPFPLQAPFSILDTLPKRGKPRRAKSRYQARRDLKQDLIRQGAAWNAHLIDVVRTLLHVYPQIKTWLKSMEYHKAVTTSRKHAEQFLTTLTASQPQFMERVELIRKKLD